MWEAAPVDEMGFAGGVTPDDDPELVKILEELAFDDMANSQEDSEIVRIRRDLARLELSRDHLKYAVLLMEASRPHQIWGVPLDSAVAKSLLAVAGSGLSLIGRVAFETVM